MIAFKVMLYVLTIGALFFSGFWELKLRNRLTDAVIDSQRESPSDYGILHGLKKQMKRERILNSLPPEAFSKYKMAVKLKFLFFAILIIEVIVLQR